MDTALEKKDKITVILADDHNLVRQGILSLLEKSGDIEIVGEASDGYQAIELVEQLEPDVLVTDIAMPRLNGIQVAKQIQSRKLKTRVVVLSMHADATLLQQALRNGAKSYLLKQSIPGELPNAIRAAHSNKIYLSSAISPTYLEKIITSQNFQTVADVDRLTAREKEVLQLIAKGHTNQSAAAALTLSIKTIEKHRANLMAKLNVEELASLIQVAIKQGLIFFDEHKGDGNKPKVG